MGAALILRNLMPLLCIIQVALPGGSPVEKSSPAAPPAIAWHTSGEVTLPFDYFRQHIYVTVSINSKPGYVFMLDSGSNRNIFNLQTSRRLGMQPRNIQQVRNIGFGDGSIYVAPEENLDIEIESIPVAQSAVVIDLNRFERHFSHRTDGILGYPFFQHFILKLDFQRKLLTLLPSDRYRYRGLGMQVPLKSSKDFVLMPVTIGYAKYLHHRVNVVVDTGSNMTLILYKPYVHSLDLESSLTHSQSARGFGLNGYYPIAVGSVDSLIVGDAETHNLPVSYLDKDEELNGVRNIPGAIGNGILQSFHTVIFDVPHRKIFFELKSPPWQSGVVRTTTADN